MKQTPYTAKAIWRAGIIDTPPCRVGRCATPIDCGSADACDALEKCDEVYAAFDLFRRGEETQ